MGAPAINWQDDWLNDHWSGARSYQELTELYNKEFHTNASKSAIKNHCHYILGIQKPRKAQRRYTEEQLQFLKENYEKMGNRELLKLFNEKFNDTRTLSAIKNFGIIHGLQVDKEVRQNNRRKHLDRPGSKRATRKSGDIRIECGRPIMKDDEGNWKTAARVIWEKEHGPVPEGYVVTVLDGNPNHIDPDNITCVPLSYIGMLSRHNLRSTEAEITKTGIMVCELIDTMKKQEKEN